MNRNLDEKYGCLVFETRTWLFTEWLKLDRPQKSVTSDPMDHPVFAALDALKLVEELENRSHALPNDSVTQVGPTSVLYSKLKTVN